MRYLNKKGIGILQWDNTQMKFVDVPTLLPGNILPPSNPKLLPSNYIVLGYGSVPGTFLIRDTNTGNLLNVTAQGMIDLAQSNPNPPPIQTSTLINTNSPVANYPTNNEPSSTAGWSPSSASAQVITTTIPNTNIPVSNIVPTIANAGSNSNSNSSTIDNSFSFSSIPTWGWVVGGVALLIGLMELRK